MKIEIMIYFYIAICACMIGYNIVYVFVLRYREKALVRNSQRFEQKISEQLAILASGKKIDEKHKKYLNRVLQRTAYITAFDRALEKMYNDRKNECENYIVEIYSVFDFLIKKYISKDTLKIAYFPYILQKYNVIKYNEDEKLTNILLELLRSVNIYCRENTLKAIYSMCDENVAVKALKIIDKNLTFHHPKLICDGLLSFGGDKEKLKSALLCCFEGFSVQMKLNILNYFRFGNIKCDDVMLGFLTNKTENPEIRFSAIRYFEKFPNKNVKEFIQLLAENDDGLRWEFQAIASSALKSYQDDMTFRILVKNLSNFNWHVRLNSAISLEKMGYTYHDLINVFDGNDRYAREIMRYRLDRHKAEEMAVKS